MSKTGGKFANSHIIVTADLAPFENLTDCLSKTADREERDDGFYMMNMEKVIILYRKWLELLPRIRPFYGNKQLNSISNAEYIELTLKSGEWFFFCFYFSAIKCNSDPVLIRQLHLLGTGFDCASKEEIESALNVGSKPSDIIYAHPLKKSSYISFATKCGVSKMTFDSKEELFKIKELDPNAEILIRFRPTVTAALFDCSGFKYGASVDDCTHILTVAKDLGLNVIGVSFHVGSWSFSEIAFEKSIESARSIFDQAEKLGFSFSILDIGGGFPGKDSESTLFEKMCDAINRSLEQHFPVSSGVEIIAEPGTYFACSSFTLVTNVIAVKEITKKEIQGVENPPVRFTEDGPDKGYMYYIDDGLFGSFNELAWYPKTIFNPEILNRIPGVHYPSCIWGDYLDTLDYVNRDCQLPKLSVGDWLYFDEFGAYTTALATNFNGFSARKHAYHYITMETWKKMGWGNEDFGSTVLFYENGKLFRYEN